ncbi:hypothetical protein [Paenibacillus periandrae]|uniref:hypothetical protein n=1 Tax=Paenibacillus periandrae TaxID=1761741 RepID=UPI001F0983EB|nr:hypothetical protein [Paenibacillus periandrae]
MNNETGKRAITEDKQPILIVGGTGNTGRRVSDMAMNNGVKRMVLLFGEMQPLPVCGEVRDERPDRQ